jgi:hypothetical protein
MYAYLFPCQHLYGIMQPTLSESAKVVRGYMRPIGDICVRLTQWHHSNAVHALCSSKTPITSVHSTFYKSTKFYTFINSCEKKIGNVGHVALAA